MSNHILTKLGWGDIINPVSENERGDIINPVSLADATKLKLELFKINLSFVEFRRMKISVKKKAEDAKEGEMTRPCNL